MKIDNNQSNRTITYRLLIEFRVPKFQKICESSITFLTTLQRLDDCLSTLIVIDYFDYFDNKSITLIIFNNCLIAVDSYRQPSEYIVIKCDPTPNLIT